MNALQELLDSSDGRIATAEVREATSMALHSMRHDRRLEALDLGATRSLSHRLFNTPDIRTFELRDEFSNVDRDENLALVGEYVHQMLIELVDVATLQNQRLQEVQRVLATRGGLMRLAELPFRMHLYDRRLALVPRDFDDNKAGAIAVREPALLRSLIVLHALIWRGAERCTTPGLVARGTNVDLMDVLEQLLAGSTDEAAAAHLHVSLRTYRRKVSELLALLGAKSRFQAGVVAQERQYIDLVKDVHDPGGGAATSLEALDLGLSAPPASSG